MRKTLTTGLLAAVLMVAFAMPSSATVHEITGMACAGPGGGNHFPPGISDDTKDNFAKPLFATGFVKDIVPFADGVMVVFDFEHPASKLAPHPTLEAFPVGDGLYISAFVIDPSHGSANCKALR